MTFQFEGSHLWRSLAELHELNVCFCFLSFFFLVYFGLFSDKKDPSIIMDGSLVGNMSEFGPQIKRQRMTPPLNERVMLYVRQDNEDIYTPLHVVPPTTVGLLNAVSLTFVRSIPKTQIKRPGNSKYFSGLYSKTKTNQKSLKLLHTNTPAKSCYKG